MTTAAPQPPRTRWQIGLDPVFLLSALIALAYGVWAPGLYDGPNPPLLALAAFKAAPVFLLCFRAIMARNVLLAYGLLFGAAGDA